MDPGERQRYSGIIHDEAIRLTRLLDDLLDLSVLENGQVTLHLRDEGLPDILDRALSATEQQRGGLAIERDRGSEDVALHTDGDRLAQVFINLISNAQKYCDADAPVLAIRAQEIAEQC